MIDEVALGLAVRRPPRTAGGRGGRDGRRHGRLPQLRDLLLQGRQAGLEGLDAARLALDEGEKRLRRVGSCPSTAAPDDSARVIASGASILNPDLL